MVVGATVRESLRCRRRVASIVVYSIYIRAGGRFPPSFKMTMQAYRVRLVIGGSSFPLSAGKF